MARKRDEWEPGSVLIKKWLDDQNKPNTRKIFRLMFKKFWVWVEEEGLFESPEAMLKDYETRTVKEQYEHVEILKRVMRKFREEELASKSRGIMLTAIRNLYAFNRTPLPKITRSDLRKMLEPSEREKDKALEKRPVLLDELKSALMEAEEPYRTIFHVMYQGGMGLAEFQLFNLKGWSQIKDQLDKPGPMKVTLFRTKVLETGVKTYYTFIGEEGKEAIRRWLKIREQKYGPMRDGEPIFLTIKKMNGQTGPPTSTTIETNMTNCLRKAGLLPKDVKLRPGDAALHCHELRDIFKSMCTLSGVKEAASEFFLGHGLDKYGYDKSPQYSVEFFQNEYLKVEPKLSLWTTKPSEIVKVTMLEKKLAEMETAKADSEKRLRTEFEARVSQLQSSVQRLEGWVYYALGTGFEKLTKEAIEDILAGRDRLAELLRKKGHEEWIAEA